MTDISQPNSNQMYGETASNCNSFTSPTFTFNTGQWYQITVVFDNNSAYHYVDGSYIGETPNYGQINCGASTTQLEADFPWTRIGENTQYVGHLDGRMRKVVQYSSALTATQVLQKL